MRQQRLSTPIMALEWRYCPLQCLVIFTRRTVRIPSVLWVSLTHHRVVQRALHPVWGPYVPVPLHLLVCYTPVLAIPVEQGSGLRLRFAPGSCISVNPNDEDFGLRILPFFVEGGSQLYPRKSIESSPKFRVRLGNPTLGCILAFPCWCDNRGCHSQRGFA